MSNNEDWKIVLLSRYCGEYPPYDGQGVPVKKSSSDIAFDLNDMGDMMLEEVSAFMATSGYKIVFDDNKLPYWLLKNNSSSPALPEREREKSPSFGEVGEA